MPIHPSTRSGQTAILELFVVSLSKDVFSVSLGHPSPFQHCAQRSTGSPRFNHPGPAALPTMPSLTL